MDQSKSNIPIVRRSAWINLIEKSWIERPIVWLAGVRRSGKTLLCQSLSDIQYFDCELPQTRRALESPEDFLAAHNGKRLVLDEIHRLDNPSEILKIAADHFPETRIIATGSSTISAGAKFRDTLAGRKFVVRLTPMTTGDLHDFNLADMENRFYRGGLPPFILSENYPAKGYSEWLEAFWARDIQSLFRLERKDSFLRFAELLLAQSGGLFDARRFAAPCGVSSPTIANYLRILESTYLVAVIRPFTTRKAAEIVSAPKVYGFDTGFICFHKGWEQIRPEDKGILWEHVVLENLQAVLQEQPVHYWRDKPGHEVDFVVTVRGRGPLAIECKWSADNFDIKNLRAFRRHYPEGENWVVAQNARGLPPRNLGGFNIRFVHPDDFSALLPR